MSIIMEEASHFDRNWIFSLFVSDVQEAASAQRNTQRMFSKHFTTSSSSLGYSPSEASSSSSPIWSRTSSSSSSSSSTSASMDVGFPAEVRYHPDEAEMRRVFQRMDENNDGLVCVKDLNRFMARFGFRMLEDEAASLVSSFGCQGLVDFENFYSLFESSFDRTSDGGRDESIEGEDEEEDLHEAFKMFDKNSDGVITALELQQVLLDLGMPEGHSIRKCERMIEKVDHDGNGEIDIIEFKALMCGKFLNVL